MDSLPNLQETKSFDKKPAHIQYEESNPSVPPHVLHFLTGQKNTWILIKLALFKMYNNNELLDYNSLIKSILDNIESFTDEKVNTIYSELEKYSRDIETNKHNAPKKESE